MTHPLSDDPQVVARLKTLQSCLDALAAMPLPDRAADLVAGALAEVQALQERDQSPIDRATFDALLALAGPQVAPDLLRQLAEDLATVAVGLPPALTADDRPAVRAFSHVLMALAGSIGANALYQAAARLNCAAHGSGPLDPSGAEVIAGLAGVRHFIDDASILPLLPESPA